MNSSRNEIATGTSKRKSLLFNSKVFHAKNATLLTKTVGLHSSELAQGRQPQAANAL
jgi:hypothetical protein